MGTYYVRKDGNDGTGNGSSAAPWVSVSKAITTVAIGGNHTILIGDGVYTENTETLGYLYFGRSFLAQVVIRPEGGALGDVRLSGLNHGSYSTRLEAATNLRFEYIKFRSQVDIAGAVFGFYGTGSHHIELYKCLVTVRDLVAGLRYGIFADPDAVKDVNNLLFDQVTVTKEGANLIEAMRLTRAADTAALHDVTIRNCTFTADGAAIRLGGVTNILVDGGTYISNGASYGIILGIDGATGREVTGVVQNAVIRSASGHGLLLGAGCNGVQALSNRITGGDQGLVVKDNDGAVISRNNIFGGNNNALYFKGATNAAATYNTIANIHGVCVRVGADGATKSQNITLQHNRIFGRGSAALLAWADAAGDLGGGVCDSNIYAPRGTGKFGAVRADASVVSLAELRAAWAGYDNPNNDAASRLLPDELPLQANTIRRHHK